MSEKYENPCTPERCDVSHCCSKGTDAGSQTWEYWRTCTTFSLYLGHQEGYAVGESERDALRAENERLRRALGVLADKVDCHACPFGRYGSPGCVTACQDGDPKAELRCSPSLVKWALSEAGEGEGC